MNVAMTREIILGYRAQVIATFIHSGYVRPFVLVGFGALSAFPGTFNPDDGITYPRGRDTDGFFHAGIGAKFPLSDMYGLRLDGRNQIGRSTRSSRSRLNSSKAPGTFDSSAASSQAFTPNWLIFDGA